ncbi:MAG: hypothetical protein ACYC6I_12500 [Bacillota bacterium]
MRSTATGCTGSGWTSAARRTLTGRGATSSKRFGEPEPFVEVQCYELLGRLGVPTLPVHGLSPRAILLEDLDASPAWRRATEPRGHPGHRAAPRSVRPARRVAPPAAIINDYHLMGIGLPYSDCRNVAGSLAELARSAFSEAYGRVDELERLLDKPTSILYGLLAASRLPRFPRWAETCLEAAR